ncbi:MAG: terminase TerL endonuclease subunit, partial [Succinimonas sp.]|nr:terminase TerL endonuclease subunit [Succinimonas sp.]
ALRKANPNWGVSVQPDAAISAQNSAKINTSAQKNFLTKYLDIWVNSDSAWLDMERYRRCIDREIKRADFAGQYAIFGIDLASKIDISAIIRVFWRPDPDTGEMHYYVFADYYLPEAAINGSDNPQYDGWRRAGFIHATGGEVTDLAALEAELMAEIPQYQTISVAYDPMQATQLSQNLLQAGAPMTEVPQTLKNLSEPMKLLQALIYAGRMHIEDNPATHWMMSNVVCHTDAKENIYPRKEKKDNKIDGAVALIMAVNQIILLDVENNYNDTAAPVDWGKFIIA